jgi:hypothetical protein
MYITDSRGLETDLRWFPLSVPIKTKKKRSRPQLDRSPGDRFPNHLLTPRTKAVSSGQFSCSTVGAKWLAQPGLTNSTYSHPPSKTPVWIDWVRISIVLVGHPFPRDFLWIYNSFEFCSCPLFARAHSHRLSCYDLRSIPMLLAGLMTLCGFATGILISGLPQ